MVGGSSVGSFGARTRSSGPGSAGRLDVAAAPPALSAAQVGCVCLGSEEQVPPLQLGVNEGAFPRRIMPCAHTHSLAAAMFWERDWNPSNIRSSPRPDKVSASASSRNTRLTTCDSAERQPYAYV